MRVNGPLIEITSVGSTVPQPNNTYYNGELAQFNEFPAFPRIDALSPTVATRGQSQPVWTYLLADGTETRVGTAGVYANPGGALMTGASLLGAVTWPNNALVFPQYQVPGAPPGTRFDQFPGSAAVTGGTTIAFKGNYTDPVTTLGMTGVYYRNVSANWGTSPIYLIANSTTRIPNQPAGGTREVRIDGTAERRRRLHVLRRHRQRGRADDGRHLPRAAGATAGAADAGGHRLRRCRAKRPARCSTSSASPCRCPPTAATSRTGVRGGPSSPRRP